MNNRSEDQNEAAESAAGILLDRDGVIIENRASYVLDWSQAEFIDGALQALASLAQLDYKIAIVTNQSAIGRRLLPMKTAEEINAKLVAAVRQAGGRIDGVFMCPHQPSDHCRCRKPRPGLIEQASEALGLDLARSVLIGDATTDIRAAMTSGVGRRILVRTGRGDRQLASMNKEDFPGLEIYADLAQALDNL